MRRKEVTIQRMNQRKHEGSLKFGEVLSIAGRALKISFNTKSKLSLMVNILGFVMAFMPIWISATLRNFTDNVQRMSQGNETLTNALFVFLFLLTLYIIQACYQFVQEYCLEMDRHRTTRYIKETIIDSSSQVQYKYVENEGDYRDKLEFAEMFGGSQVAGSMQQTIIVLQQMITFMSISFVLWSVNAWIVVILLITCIPSVILSIMQKDEEYKNKTKNMKEGAMSVHLFYMASGANEHGKSMNDVRFYGIYPWIKEKWRVVSQDYVRKKNELSKKHLLYNSIADILRNGVYIGILLLVAKQIYDNPLIGLGTFMLVFTLTGQLQNATTTVFVGAAKFFGDLQYMRDFFELQDTPKEEMNAKPEQMDNADIGFHHVSFVYPNSSRTVLKLINVHIKQGEKIAIVGENGSGKSTFINLLCGMYEPTSGRVTVNDYEVKENLSTVRNAISVVFQNFGRYETTLRNNITISNRERRVDDDEIMGLAKKANAHSIITSQANGLDEEVGTFSKNGNNLSGGQWQKIAITRALYRDQARIMILDEPTAALDPVAEAQLYRDFTELTGDKTTILISHRMGITAIVDRILVFADGEIVEDGNHEELLGRGGQYARMYQAQAQWYNDELFA